jgi:hypothetical protein
MGAHNYECTYPGTDFKELQTLFQAEMEESLYEDGHNAYSGGLGTLTGIQLVADPFPADPWDDTGEKKQKVIDHLLDTASKWEDALAVRMPGEFIVVAWLAE